MTDLDGALFEKNVRNITVRIYARDNETVEQLVTRLHRICDSIESIESANERKAWTLRVQSEVDATILQVAHLFGISRAERNKIGLTDDYQMVILSLLKNFDQSMGASAVAKEWNINSGRVSRVFTGSRKKYEKYQAHFEKCEARSYRFTELGFSYAIEYGIPELLGKKTIVEEGIEII